MKRWKKKNGISLVCEQFSFSNNLVEKAVKMEYDTCPTLKIENENLEG